eukprot:SAG11_NODE_20441_length_445_cov_0.745665_2_plen_104_part_01
MGGRALPASLGKAVAAADLRRLFEFGLQASDRATARPPTAPSRARAARPLLAYLQSLCVPFAFKQPLGTRRCPAAAEPEAGATAVQGPGRGRRRVHGWTAWASS